MTHAGFVHLRVHSAYSLSEGALKTGELLKLAADDAMPALAVTDSGNLFGALEFAMAAREAGVQPIIGCQIVLDWGSGAEANGQGSVCGPAVKETVGDQLVLLVQDERGYGNLTKLLSRAYLESAAGAEPRVTRAALTARAEGLIALTGGPGGTVGRLLAEGRTAEARATLVGLNEIFPGRLYVELQRHGLPGEAAIEAVLIDFAYAQDLPLVATNDAYFAAPELFEAHDALLCIAGGTYVGEQERRRLTPEHYLKRAEEMRRLFADIPEAVDNTLVVARRCSFAPSPVKPILPRYNSAKGLSEAEELAAQAEAGLEARLETHVFTADMDEASREAAARPYRERLRYELEVIVQMGFAGYHLIVADFIKWAKGKGVPVGPGRGSGAGSVVAWALTITDLDPLRWGLLFERFLNPERVSMPDFDIDFCQERRDEVIRYVQEKYGHDRVAQIITFGKLQARAALRDVGRVLQLPYGQVDRICKLVPNNPANPVALADAIAAEPRLQEEQRQDEAVARMIDVAIKLEGLYRHASTHAAGVVIGDRPLDEMVPLYRDPRSDMPVTQFSMKHVELAGLVKFDFLGLKTLSVLARAVALIAEGGSEVVLEEIPLDDGKTYEMLGRGETVGVFQLESSGMRDVLKRLRPDRFEDIIAVVALYRPGPMDNIPSYISRKHGEEEPDYLYPSLEGILRETFGIMIYQEQVMQIAQELAGYSLGAADLLRRAMGKKIRSEMEQQRKVFIEGATARGVAKSKAALIFEQMAKFAGYGFNKSHAAAYALVAYQTAYLKANYPVEFMAASMTFDMGNTDKLSVFRQELARLGIPLLAPDVNHSQADFGVARRADAPSAIRYALGAIKNVGFTAMKGLVAEREAGGPYQSLADFCARLDARAVNKRQIENLARAGAFDSLENNRRAVVEGADSLVRLAAAAAEERQSSQVNLFGESASALGQRLSLPAVADWPTMERLREEFGAIGFYLSAHPLEASAEALQRLGVLSYEDLLAQARQGPGRRLLAGILTGKQERTSRQGNRFAFLQLSDPSGVFEVVVFSEVLARARELLETGQGLLIAVEARGEGDELRLMAQEITRVEDAIAQAGGSLTVYFESAEPLASLKELLGRGEPGRGRVHLVLTLADGGEAELELGKSYRLAPQLRQAIKAIPGVEVMEA